MIPPGASPVAGEPRSFETEGSSLKLNLTKSVSEPVFLPPSFEIIPPLLEILEDPDSDTDDLTNLIRVDPGLTADVLQICNSASVAGVFRAETLEQAVMRLGAREIYNVVMSVVASPVFKRSEDTGIARLNLWRHSLAASVSARVIAEMIGEDPEPAYTAALLHDVGKVLLGQAFGDEYIQLIESCKTTHEPFYAAEKQKFRTTHHDLGGKLLLRWNFPDRIAAAIAHHHDPLRAERRHERFAALVYLANIMAYRVGEGYGEPSYVSEPDPICLKIIDLKLGALPEIQDICQHRFAAERQRFSW